MKPYFYKITNTLNNKYYYGSGSKSLGNNYFGSSFLLKRAIEKYGIENFKFEVLKHFETRNEAFEFEDRFLKIFRISEDPNSYNLKDAGMGGDTWSYSSEESKVKRKLKLSQSLKGKERSEEHCKKISNSKKGRTLQKTDKMSLCKHGNKNGMFGQGEKISGEKNGQYGMSGEKSPNWGKKHKPETIQLMKEKAKRGPRTEEEKKKMSDGIKKNMKYFIRQISRTTGEIVEDHLTCKDASIKTGIKYHKVYCNIDENFEFTRVYKDQSIN
jgi:group I intron endonuclease